jgi:hypothetical protein
MTFPSASFTDSSPRTFRSCSSEMRFLPSETCFVAKAYNLKTYWLRDPKLAGFWETYSGSFFDSSYRARSSGCKLNKPPNFRSSRFHGCQPPGITGDDFCTLNLVDAQSKVAHQTHRRFEQLFTSDQDRLRLTGSKFLKSDVEHVARSAPVMHEIAVLDRSR